MAQVKLEIGGRNFNVSCQDGEEAHIHKLAGMIDERSSGAGDPAALTESRMLLFAALILADELDAANKNNAAPVARPEEKDQQADEQTILALEKLAERAETFASSLE